MLSTQSTSCYSATHSPHLYIHSDDCGLQHQEPDPFWKEVAPSFRNLTARELASFSDPTWVHGWKWTTVIVDMPIYMAFLLQSFLQVLSI